MAAIALWRVKALLDLRKTPGHWPAVVANRHGGQFRDFRQEWEAA